MARKSKKECFFIWEVKGKHRDICIAPKVSKDAKDPVSSASMNN